MLFAGCCGAPRAKTVTVAPRGFSVNGEATVCYTYTEYGSKNRSGGLKQLSQENKVVHQYESANAEKCPVRLLDKYISKLPPDAKKNDVFYLKPKANIPHDPMAPWFLNVPVGRNMLAGTMKTMALEGSLEKTVTNHSLVAYGVTKCSNVKSQESLSWSAVDIGPYKYYASTEEHLILRK